jgi:hypothetical protein
VVKVLPALKFDYKSTALNVTDTGHTSQINAAPPLVRPQDASRGVRRASESVQGSDAHDNRPTQPLNGRAIEETKAD